MCGTKEEAAWLQPPEGTHQLEPSKLSLFSSEVVRILAVSPAPSAIIQEIGCNANLQNKTSSAEAMQLFRKLKHNCRKSHFTNIKVFPASA